MKLHRWEKELLRSVMKFASNQPIRKIDQFRGRAAAAASGRHWKENVLENSFFIFWPLRLPSLSSHAFHSVILFIFFYSTGFYWIGPGFYRVFFLRPRVLNVRRTLNNWRRSFLLLFFWFFFSDSVCVKGFADLEFSFFFNSSRLQSMVLREKIDQWETPAAILRRFFFPRFIGTNGSLMLEMFFYLFSILFLLGCWAFASRRDRCRRR